MSKLSNTARLFAVFTALSLTAAACSGGDEATVETTVETTTPPTTEAPVETTEKPAPFVGGAPFTGLEAADGVDLNRPALAVKIDNHPDARPQSGLDQADMVIEMRAEGVTRFLAVFHSQNPSPIGPVRSSRTSDFDLLKGLSEPLYASSGGNNYVASGLRSLPITAVTALTEKLYFRDNIHAAPHNLYANSEDLFALAPEGAKTPTPWFAYRAEGTDLPDSATAITGPVTIAFPGGPIVTHTWDAATSGWLRTQDGRPHTTIDGDQLSPENVVIMETVYVQSPADAISPELVSVGSGKLYVLTDGHVIEGRWERETAEVPPTLTDDDGDPILLTPGRTWVLYPEDAGTLLPQS